MGFRQTEIVAGADFKIQQPFIENSSLPVWNLSGACRDRGLILFEALPQVFDQRQTLMGGEGGDFCFAQNGHGDSLRQNQFNRTPA